VVDAVIDYRQSGSFFAQMFEMLVFVTALAGSRFTAGSWRLRDRGRSGWTVN
jgi:hypothetical protein